MKCWICGGNATTGEHLLKASDVRSCFPWVSQKQPLRFSHASGGKSLLVGSAKSDRFKSETPICAHCNNARTKPYDQAWEKLSLYLRENLDRCAKRGKADLSRVFPGRVRSSFLDVHLFFVKVFGCRIADDGIDLDLSGFAKAILKREAHPQILIQFGRLPAALGRTTAGISEINRACFGKLLVTANWFYIVGGLGVMIFYVVYPGTSDPRLAHALHPTNVKKFVDFQDFKPPKEEART